MDGGRRLLLKYVVSCIYNFNLEVEFPPVGSFKLLNFTPTGLHIQKAYASLGTSSPNEYTKSYCCLKCIHRVYTWAVNNGIWYTHWGRKYLNWYMSFGHLSQWLHWHCYTPFWFVSKWKHGKQLGAVHHYRPRSKGDYMLGSVRPSVRLSVIALTLEPGKTTLTQYNPKRKHY